MKKIIFSLLTVFLLVSCSWNSNNLEDEGEISNPTTMQEMKEDLLGTQTILALWDSLTAWYWVQISESYPSKLEAKLLENNYDYKIINAGVSGDTSKNLLDRAVLYKDQEPGIVLLVIGWNDGLRAGSTDTLKENIQKIIDMYKWESVVVLWWMEIPGNFGGSYTNNFKQLYFDIAQENDDIYFLESFLKDVGWVTRLNQADRIHPTSEWYDIIVQNLYEYLEEEDIIQK